MTLVEFSEIFALLAKQLRQTDADEADIDAYYRTLADLEPEFVAMAAVRLAKTAEWFPKTSEWRQEASKAEVEQRALLAHRLRALHKAGVVLCLACDDTGWSLHAPSGRYMACKCLFARRLEILGRRPMPALPPAQESDPAASARVEALVAKAVKALR